jgi:hypothetical protein
MVQGEVGNKLSQVWNVGVVQAFRLYTFLYPGLEWFWAGIVMKVVNFIRERTTRLKEKKVLYPAAVLWTGNSVGSNPKSRFRGWINLGDYAWVSLESDSIRL